MQHHHTYIRADTLKSRLSCTLTTLDLHSCRQIKVYTALHSKHPYLYIQSTLCYTVDLKSSCIFLILLPYSQSNQNEEQ